jgi:hypothetical protein
MHFELSHIKQKRVQYLETLGFVNQCGEYRGRTPIIFSYLLGTYYTSFLTTHLITHY